MFTKFTTVTYAPESFDQTQLLPQPSQYVLDVEAKVQEMIDAGKAPGLYPTRGPGEYSYTRLWLDEAAAEEWKAFQLAKTAEYGLVITDYVIGDTNT